MLALAGKPDFSVEYVQPFVDSMRDLFRGLGLSVATNLPVVKRGAEPAFDVSAVMPFVSMKENKQGRAVISLPREVACRLASDHLVKGTTPDQAVSSILDRIARGIASGAKQKLQKHAVTMQAPTIVQGRRTGALFNEATCLAMPCACRYGDMEFAISIVSADRH